jgi:hypothetical protein
MIRSLEGEEETSAGQASAKNDQGKDRRQPQMAPETVTTDRSPQKLVITVDDNV